MEFFKKHIILADIVLLVLLGIMVFINIKGLLECKAYGVETATEAGNATVTEYVTIKGMFGNEHQQPVYAMEFEGESYTRDSLVAEKTPSVAVGESVEVLYDTANPAHFYTETEIKYADNKQEGYQTRSFLFGGISVVMIIIFVGDIKKKVQEKA